MRAVVINEYGDRSKLVMTELDKPKPGKGQVLIKVQATSINPIDWKVREGYLKDQLPFSFPAVLGWDAAGIIEDTGEDVDLFKQGDEVFVRPETTNRGTYADYIVTEANLLAKIPNNKTFSEAAAVPLAGLTAYQCLVDFGKIKEGDRVLIHGGGGGVGTMAIQIAKRFGAHVIATGSDKSEALINELGADQFVNYKKETLKDVVTNVDLVFDTIGGKTQTESYSVIKKGGKLVSITQPPNEDEAREHGVEAGFVWLEPNGEELEVLASMMAEGVLKPVIQERLPFSEKGVRRAHELSESGHAKGKIVVEMQ